MLSQKKWPPRPWLRRRTVRAKDSVGIALRKPQRPCDVIPVPNANRESGNAVSMQFSLFRKKIVDVLGRMPGGVTAPQWIRADDGLSYVVKDEAPNIPSVRASEYLWLSLARLVALPAPVPEIIIDSHGRELFATRRENSAVDMALHLVTLLSGNVMRGGIHLSRIYAFDLFAANWDRHPNNYLVLDDGGGSQAVFAIDLSHVPAYPGLAQAARDPLLANTNATRAYFPQVVRPYGADPGAAVEIVDRLASLPGSAINAILSEIPVGWLWWGGRARSDRTDTLRQGLQNGTLI
jgi:hypothetical protein